MLDLNEDMEEMSVLLVSIVGGELHNLILRGTYELYKYEQKDK